MGENTSIEWATHTFNPWEGCQKVGPGCDHCYAETRNARFGGGGALNWGPGAPRRRTSPSNWRKPLAWDREAAATGIRPRVFCASLADVFDNAVDSEWRKDLFAIIGATPSLDWLLLTKRIGNVGSMLDAIGHECLPDNVWLGATVVNQVEADRDIPKLLTTPAAKRFLSIEPLLGPINLAQIRYFDEDGDELVHCPLTGRGVMSDLGYYHPGEGPWVELTAGWAPTLDWVIVGGESGSGARPVHPDWARDLRDQCAAADVPFLFKQWGEWAPNKVRTMLDGDRPGELVGSTIISSTDRTQVGRRVFYAMPKDAKSAPGAVERMERVGKKAAGRLLDGVEHNGMPV